MDEKLLWIAKRLVDVAKDFEGLSEEDKQLVIERAEKLSPYPLIDLYNSLGDYGEL